MNTSAITFFYLDSANQSQGPVTPRELNALRKTGRISWDSQIAEPGADEWLAMSAYADIIDPTANVTSTASLKTKETNPTLKATGTGLQVLGAAVTLVNPIVGVGMIAAGSQVKKAGQ